MKTVYHYTDEKGFHALSSGGVWFPSTGIPLPYQRDEPKDLFVFLLESLLQASKTFYSDQYQALNYTNTRSSRFPDVDYGPGWYVTETPPDSETSSLLDELWQGRADCEEKTRFWLKLIVTEIRLKRPDVANRPSVAYLPIYNGMGASNRPAGINADPAFLVEAGSRSQAPGQPPKVQVLHSYDPPIEAVTSMIAYVNNWASLDADIQCNTLGFLGFDSGFPGIPFPEAVDGLSLDQRQFFVIAQIATKFLGTDFNLIDVTELDTKQSKRIFSFDIVGKLRIESDEHTVIIHCRSQKSPMRLEHVNDLRARAGIHGASLIIVFVTSTFAQNTVQVLFDMGAAPILITSSLATEFKRPVLRITRLDTDLVSYPDHNFWFPVFSESVVRYERLRDGREVLQQLSL